MNKQFKVEKVNGMYVVMVLTPMNTPIWKFWAPKFKWEIAVNKNGKHCIYAKLAHARSYITFQTR
jgi:hypothetical protein